jgi:hypothetical protein
MIVGNIELTYHNIRMNKDLNPCKVPEQIPVGSQMKLAFIPYLYSILISVTYAQDTLLYKGLIMTPRTSLTISPDGKCTCSDSTINPGLDQLWFRVNKSFDYLSELDKGVFISKYTRLNNELVFDTLWRHTEYPLIHKNLLKDSLQTYHLFEPPISSFVNDKCGKMFFYILYVEFKYIRMKSVSS